MVACNYKDAYVLIKNPDYKKRDDKEPADKDLQSMSPREIHYAEGFLGGPPTLVEWTSYMFPIIGCYWGASMEYRDF